MNPESVEMETSDMPSKEFQEAKGLASFLAKLPQTEVENLVTASNIPKSNSFTHAAMINRRLVRHLDLHDPYSADGKDLRRWSSSPDLRRRFSLNESSPSSRLISNMARPSSAQSFAVVGQGDQSGRRSPMSDISDSSSFHIDSRLSIPEEGTDCDQVEHVEVEMERVFVPLLHILPREDAMNASVQYNPFMRIVQPLKVSDNHHYSKISFSFDSNGNEVMILDEIEEEPENVDEDEEIMSSCDIDSEDIVVIPRPALERSATPLSKHADTSMRSAFDALVLDSSSAESEESILGSDFEMVEDQMHGTVVPVSPSDDKSLEGPSLSFPATSFHGSKIWMEDVRVMARVMQLIESTTLVQRGIMKHKDLVDPLAKSLVYSKWKKYHVELRGHILFFFTDSSEVDSGKRTPKAFMEVDNAHIDIAYTDTKSKNALRISLMNGYQCVLKMPSQAEMIGWAHVLRGVVDASPAAFHRLPGAGVLPVPTMQLNGSPVDRDDEGCI